MSRRYRLSRSRDFDAVYRKGRSVSTRYLVLYSFPREEEAETQEPRLGLAISRKCGGAVVRNRLKRRLRTAFEELAATLAPQTDYVLVVRPGFTEAAEAQDHRWFTERVAEVFGLTFSEQEARA